MSATLTPSPSLPLIETAEARTHAAVAALVASRLRLRQQLLPKPQAGAAAGAGRSDSQPSAQDLWQQLRHMTQRWPAAQLLAGAIQGWWQAWWPAWWNSQPLRAEADLLATGLQARLIPIVQRHPVATVAGAALVGALLVAGRPWRWPLVGDQLRPLPGRVGLWLAGQLASVPIQTALVSLLMKAWVGPSEAAATNAHFSATPNASTARPP